MTVAAAPSWRGAVVARYTWLMIALTGAASAALFVVGPPPPLVRTAVMVVLVALVGLPHGAYDLEVGRRRYRPRLGAAWWVFFVGAYLALAAIGLALWTALPLAGLLLLLVGGAAHWGDDDLERPPHRTLARLLLATSRGAIPVAVPLVAFPDETAAIFGALLDDAAVDPATIRGLATAGLGLAAPGIAWSIVRATRAGAASGARASAEVATLVAWCSVAPPLLAFAGYFCLWHAVRHSMASASRIDPADPRRAAGRYVRRVAFPTALTLVLAVPTAWWLARGATGEETPVRTVLAHEHDWWRLVFVGLFALTVPHVLLEWLEARRERSPSTNAATGDGSSTDDAVSRNADQASGPTGSRPSG